MTLQTDVESAVNEILRTRWTTREGQKVPDTEDVQLGNHAVLLDATVLYADMSDSTDLVDRYKPAFAAEMYKSFLYSAAKIIRARTGVITSFDGDRIMGVFIGTGKNTHAAKCALQINYAVKKIINPAISNQYGANFLPDQTRCRRGYIEAIRGPYRHTWEQ